MTLSANVSSSGCTPTGTVSFTANGSSIGCTARELTSGVATCTTLTLPPGSNAIVATYTPTGNFAASTSASFNQAVITSSQTSRVPSAPINVAAVPGVQK